MDTLKPDAAHILQTILSGRLPQTILLEGEARSGKMTLAMHLAAALLCSERLPGAPACGKCRSCHKVQERIHPDLTILEEEDIKVDAARALRLSISVIPNDGERRIVLIRHAQRMNIAAQNALLKSLEEPPHYVSFILTAERPEALLQTILSRCTRYALVPPVQALFEEDLLPVVEPILRALANADECALLLATMGLEKLTRQKQKEVFAVLRVGIRDAAFAADGLTGRLLPQWESLTDTLARKLTANRLLRLAAFLSTLTDRLEVNAANAATSSALCAGAFTICYGNDSDAPGL